MTNKICTSIEQSKKLIELGIDVKTADMCYIQDLLAWCKYGDYKPYIGNVIPAYGQDKIPAWSLSALIDLMPERIKIGEELSFCLTSKKSSTGFSFSYNLNGSTFIKDNQLDAAFEMVYWLKENGNI